MNKVELEIINITQGFTQHHSYAVVLGEVKGKRRLPIVIGAAEAQAIAVAVEKMLPNRPLTHDLFKSTMDTFGIDVREVIISNLLDGVFYARLVCVKDGESFEIDSRTSDALAIAVRFTCPIYTYEFILEAAGVVLEESEEPSTTAGSSKATSKTKSTGSTGGGRASDSRSQLSHLSLDELNRMLDEVLANEDYEQAALIRDELKKREG